MAGGVSVLLLLADLLSPGPLARGHEKLEGIKNCTQCHEAGQQVSAQKCLDCHKELNARVQQKAGFHGKLKDLTCNACHHEHQGKDFDLIEWPSGAQKTFDHTVTGFALRQKHAAVDCQKCHLAAPKTFLGAKTSCAQCHFDEHRGQLPSDCAKCHDEHGWKPAPGFSHAKADFVLRGAHVKVDCLKCHGHETDKAQKEFTRFKPVAHTRCTDCHQDPHQTRFGLDCERCHVEDSWTQVKSAGGGGERAFHEKTRYPLRGLHAQVACKDCHGPFPGKKAVFKGLAFDTCTACHSDAHQGQLKQTCDRCHDVDGFRPAHFEVKDHASTRYPLQGSHAAVACMLCHLQDKKPPAKLVSRVLFHPQSQRCEDCHRDPHQGQLQRGCAACHQVTSFHDVKLDHDRDTRFALTGAHRKAACASAWHDAQSVLSGL
jgi:hypothetical protein